MIFKKNIFGKFSRYFGWFAGEVRVPKDLVIENIKLGMLNEFAKRGVLKTKWVGPKLCSIENEMGRSIENKWAVLRKMRSSYCNFAWEKWEMSMYSEMKNTVDIVFRVGHLTSIPHLSTDYLSLNQANSRNYYYIFRCC
jgi:hypothetical protein